MVCLKYVSTFVVDTIVKFLFMRLEKELKMKGFASPYERAILSVIFTGNWLVDQINTTLKPFGISEQHYNILRILKGQKDKPANLFMIQERMMHRMSNATRLVEKLRKMGLVERKVCEQNRRMVEITITKQGLTLLAKTKPLIENKLKSIYKSMNEQEALLLGDLLDKLRS